MRDITIAAPFVRQSLEGAVMAGYDIRRLLKDTGIALQLLDQDRSRVPLEAFVRLQQRTFSLMNDEAVGLLEKPIRYGTFAVVARSVLHCETVGDAFQLLAKHHNLFETGLYHETALEGGELVYRIHRRNAQSAKNHFAIESVLMTIHRFVCWLCANRVPLTAVLLDYPAPDWEREYRHLFVGVPVLFKQREISLRIREEAVRWRVSRDIASLEDYIRRAPRDLYEPFEGGSLGERVRREMIRSMRRGDGMPAIVDMANKLELHPQTLRRRLAEENSDFTEIRSTARRDSAVFMLSSTDFSVEEIAEILDYSEASAFIRAFRQWMGVTPLAYRKM